MRKRNCRGRSTETKRVMRYLAKVVRSEAKVIDPIVEKLRLCPEAFKLGEILGKAFDTLKYWQEDDIEPDRIPAACGHDHSSFA